MSYRELWTRMLAVTGRRKRVFRLGPAAKVVGRAIDLAHRWLPLAEGDINGAAIAMGSFMHYYNSSKAQLELEYRPKIEDHFLSDVWNWLITDQQTNRQ